MARFLAIVVLAVVIYVFSYGPAIYLWQHGLVSYAVLDRIYTPVDWAFFNDPHKRPKRFQWVMQEYLDLWKVNERAVPIDDPPAQP